MQYKLLILVIIIVAGVALLFLRTPKEPETVNFSTEQSTTPTQENNTSPTQVQSWQERIAPLPEDLSHVTETNGMLTLKDTAGSLQVRIGGSLSPDGRCQTLFYDTATDTFISPYVGAEERTHVIRYTCSDAETVGPYELPVRSTAAPYSDYGARQRVQQYLDTLMVNLIHSQVGTDHIETITTHGNRLAQWADTHHVNIAVDGNKLLLEGPNAGGTSPIIWPSLSETPSRGYNLTTVLTKYLQLERALNSPDCANNFFATYSSTLQEHNPPPNTVAQDLSCLGRITFSPATFGDD